MSNETYLPKPIDTSHVSLSPELETLIQELARNTHEVWAQKRMQEGCSFGSKRDDAHKKKHPDLVPYEDLTEVERSYDGEVVTQVVKGILALGYGIVKR